MANIDQAPTKQAVRPGPEDDGMDPYPTYRDGPVTPHRATADKPTDVGLPQTKRSFGFPIFIGLVIFAAAIVAGFVWGGLSRSESPDGQSALSHPETPAATAPAQQ
jgi:hypothetical protein